ncbi:hypothetical protein [Pinibacter aurantiacus]|uniref:Uncharacterized protein n=1 Tax=Pinibacter aurantiacus TaxID=2851599 RepID=A0A9E2S9T8_9BACT|nr:hypothetical protein [Pinibacter aurantiacus]MBV4357309.1 hypothetical protein [Pinibacter aurantiacus]
METEYVITDDALRKIQSGLDHGKCWLAFNTYKYFLEKEDVRTFSDRDEAEEYCYRNIGEYECFEAVRISSIKDLQADLKFGFDLDKFIHSQNNTIFMEENVITFNEKQLQRTGFAEAFTPELQQKMNERVPVIEHVFKKEFDGDKVNATLHLRKSESSDHYHLNKFDLSLQKEGQLSETKQTFYINTVKSMNAEGEKNPDNLFTLKEGYNLLAGRPVFKHMTNIEGNAYDSWVQLNLKNKLETGNFEMKQYTKNYGFDLESVLNKYPIKELTNDQYKANLVDSLNRGNLQKATFVGADGKEEKLYISPVVTMSQLNVYDLDKQRIPTEKLLEKGLVGTELAVQLKERMKQPTEAEAKLGQSENLKESHKQTLKQATEQKTRKQSIKHKHH